MKTFSAKPHEVERKWYVIDAKDKVLGQVAVEAARLLRGKHKPIFTTHVDTGDFVVVVNADKVVLSGNKEQAKVYTRFSGYVGGKKVETPRQVRDRRPVLLVERAVWGMLRRPASAAANTASSRCMPVTAIPTNPSNPLFTKSNNTHFPT